MSKSVIVLLLNFVKIITINNAKDVFLWQDIIAKNAKKVQELTG